MELKYLPPHLRVNKIGILIRNRIHSTVTFMRTQLHLGIDIKTKWAAGQRLARLCNYHMPEWLPVILDLLVATPDW